MLIAFVVKLLSKVLKTPLNFVAIVANAETFCDNQPDLRLATQASDIQFFQ